MRGHNWGLCQKCGREHKHPRGMLGKKHPNPGFKKGMIAWNKGKQGWMSQEGRASIARSNSTRYNSPETRYKMGSSFRGKPSHRKGKHLPLSHRLNIARGMRNSGKFRESIRKYHEEKVKAFLRKLYDIPEDLVFFPASRYDHEFARFVLIEKRFSMGFVHIRLREHPEWVKTNANESEIPVVI